MSHNKNLDLMHQYAGGYQFQAFSDLFEQAISTLTTAELAEAILMRAQIKLVTADQSIIEDLEQAETLGPLLIYPCLSNIWRSDAPNRLNVFLNKPGMLSSFRQVLPRAQEMLGKYLGKAGSNLVRQLRCELHYFTGELDAALTLAEQHESDGINTSDFLVLCIKFRCYLAMGLAQKAEDCMLEMIRFSKVCPECQASYQSIRKWVNLTTNWGGDSPRYYNMPDGTELPVLDDRLKALQGGMGKITMLEAPFVAYGRQSYASAYTLRQHYVDIFNALYWYQMGDLAQVERYFLNVRQTIAATGLIMPLVECGMQGFPLLQHMWKSSSDGLRDTVMSMAKQYEESLSTYQELRS